MKKIIYVFSIFQFLLLSCEKEVKIDIPGYEEKVVVDGVIETGQPPLVLLSKTKNIYAPTNLDAFLSGFISGATVTVSDGTNTVVLDEICTNDLPPGTEELAASIFGIPVEELANYNLCAYSSFNPLIFGQVGKTYSLKVEYNGETFTSSADLVSPTHLDSVYWKADPKYPDYGFSYAWLTDPFGVYDAYMWEVKRINKNTQGNPVDSRFFKPFNPVVDDKFFDGLSFEFFYENPMSFQDETVPNNLKGFYKQGDTVVIKFSKMDRNVYQFLEKKYIQISTGGSPFSAPANIPSNIKGGALGLWAAYSTSFDTLVCKP
jgi:hypothetical protein